MILAANVVLSEGSVVPGEGELWKNLGLLATISYCTFPLEEAGPEASLVDDISVKFARPLERLNGGLVLALSTV
jgi:hypothetical protein